MKTLYDAEADALYVRFADAPVVESEEVSKGVALDLDADGRIATVRPKINRVSIVAILAAARANP
jgi:uncharacterized protein YuzE